MKEYLITCSVTAARGTQEWIVKADSEADAKARWAKGQGECVSEEMEVMDIEVSGIELNE